VPQLIALAYSLLVGVGALFALTRDSDSDSANTSTISAGDSTTTESSAATATSAAATTSTPSTETTTPAGDLRIVSLSATATEMLFAIDAGDFVIAVDEQSNYPPEAPTQSDLSGFEPNLEAIAAYEPSLVVISYDPGDFQAGLEALGIEVLVQPAAATVDDTYAQIEQLGGVTGNVAESAALVLSMQTDIEEILTGVDESVEMNFYHELGDQLYSASSSSFIGQLYTMVGLTNIADEADPDGYGYPQLSAEYILEQDPDLIFLADTVCCGQSQDTLTDRPGWDELTAVQTNGVVPLDDDIASRWGPRIVELLDSIVSAVNELQPAEA
ncbi:MAG: ABC transporter substrate-binding protein, partial [Acidimicrobiales bacterium]